MKNLNVIAAGLFSFVIAGCVSGPAVSEVNGKPIEIGTGTQSALATYLQQVKTTRPGAFAVSEDGKDSYAFWCEEMTCTAISYANPAVDYCESLSGKPCVALYVRNAARYTYTQARGGEGQGKHGSKKSIPTNMLFVND